MCSYFMKLKWYQKLINKVVLNVDVPTISNEINQSTLFVYSLIAL